MTIAVVSSYTGKCLPVLLTSLRCYAPQWKVVVASKTPPVGFDVRHVPHFGRNFGEAFQYAITKAVEIYPDEERIVMLNDDCVLRPDTMSLMERDFTFLRGSGRRLGLLVTRCDFVRGIQNVRIPHDGDRKFNGFKLMGEDGIAPIKYPIPVAGMFEKSVWEKHPIQPIGWSADDVWSYDMTQSGLSHFMSVAYVHHVGGETTNNEAAAVAKRESNVWIRENRPGLYAEMVAEFGDCL